MAQLTTDQILILIGYAGAIVGVYVAMNMRISALEIEMKQVQKDNELNRSNSQKFDERVTNKFDAIMNKMEEKFEFINEKMNELIKSKF